MSGLNVGDAGATMAVTNTSNVATKDTLVFDLVVEGERRLYGVEVKLAPGSGTQIDVRFLQTVSSPVISLCANKPIGIIESGDPVLGIVAEPPLEAPVE